MCAAAISTPGTGGSSRGSRLAWSASATALCRRNVRPARMARPSCSPIDSVTATSDSPKCPWLACRTRVSAP